ncbi:hypothetical protein RIF29_08343 [Crotalaria pallida]|uniref:Uncharacterized protein n=1 Tax=Crotalaria pallida TaxID=3830 RepID=A0AAN9FQN3_CROPI
MSPFLILMIYFEKEKRTKKKSSYFQHIMWHLKLFISLPFVCLSFAIFPLSSSSLGLLLFYITTHCLAFWRCFHYHDSFSRKY